MTHALLIKMSSLGDVVHALPAITDAARHGVQFDWVVEEAFAPIAARHPAVRNVLPIAWRRWRKSLWQSRSELREWRTRLRERDYAMALDSQGLYKSAVVARVARAQHRWGFDQDSAREGGASRLYSDTVEIPRALHAIERQRRLFAAAFDYAKPQSEPDYGLHSDAAKGKSLLFLHGTTWPSKHWPDSTWEQLVTIAVNAGFAVNVTWGDEAEQQRAETLKEAGAHVWPRMALAALIERITEMRLVVGVDSGLMHLAAALGVPTLGLYGSTDATLTGVQGAHTDSLSVNYECAPCVSRQCQFSTADHLIHPPCYATLPAERVWQKATDLLDADRFLHI